MKQIWCDFDGVIVCNEMHSINTANIAQAEFAVLVTRAYEQNPETSPVIREIIRQNRQDGTQVTILTGRKKSDLGLFTNEILRNHKIKVDDILFYPEENTYEQKEYFSWKTTVISSSMKKTDTLETWVIDDDLQLLRHLKTQLPTGNLRLTHYELHLDKQDTIAHL